MILRRDFWSIFRCLLCCLFVYICFCLFASWIVKLTCILFLTFLCSQVSSWPWCVSSAPYGGHLKFTSFSTYSASVDIAYVSNMATKWMRLEKTLHVLLATLAIRLLIALITRRTATSHWETFGTVARKLWLVCYVQRRDRWSSLCVFCIGNERGGVGLRSSCRLCTCSNAQLAPLLQYLVGWLVKECASTFTLTLHHFALHDVLSQSPSTVKL